jgi:hypothetical protein
MELVVPEGRQNCYLAIVCFLLSCQTFANHHRSSSDGDGGEGGGGKRSTLLGAPLKEFFVEVLGDV